jgi:transmembrane 9 superfamily protein 2/4
MGGTDWKSSLILTTTGFPTYVTVGLACLLLLTSIFSFVSSLVFLLNLFLIGSGASGAMPFGTMLAIAALYFLVSGPLCVTGYFYGMRYGVSLDAIVLVPL